MPMDTDTNVIALRPRQSAPVATHPRAHFGVRAGMEAAREDDLRQQQRIKALAREARNAFDQAHVCPTLKAELSGKIAIVAEMCASLADQAKSLGDLEAAVALRKQQSDLETLSAEVSTR